MRAGKHEVDLAEVKEAARLLVTSEQATELFAALDSVVRNASLLPVRISGGGADMNPLLEAYRSDKELYRTVMSWVDNKRAELGKTPFVEDQGFDKTGYMREFMQNKRVRERRAVEIENLERPERDKLIGRSRMDFVAHQSTLWKKERDQMLKAAREARHGALPKDELTGVLDLFWAKIDARLDDRSATVRRAKFSPGSRSGPTLKALLESDPYKKIPTS
jgi:hypothetical protein